jgi:hypothetical protein
MDCSVADLKAIVAKILDHVIEDIGVTELKLENNFYWSISEEELYKLNDEKPTLSVGSLADDWEFLRSLLNEEREQSPSLMLIHAAPLLRYIGQRLGQ